MPDTNKPIGLLPFQPWDNVRYVPDHAKGDPTHKDCQNGIVHQVDHEHGTVFVRYITNSRCSATACSTRTENLLQGHW